jgi:hypothetical protein
MHFAQCTPLSKAFDTYLDIDNFTQIYDLQRREDKNEQKEGE